MSAPVEPELLALRVHPGINRAAVIAALFAEGVQGVQELDEDLLTLVAGSAAADRVTAAVRGASADARVETTPAPRVDWTEAWRHGVRAQRLGPITIAPPWLAGASDPAATVVIDPGMAFGTGEHATTRGVVRLLARVLEPGDRVADLGAGSAVLAIAAVKLGASRVAAIEHDADAIGNAEANVARNDVAGRVVVIEGDAGQLLPLVAPVELVMANILSSVLVELLPAIEAALVPGGRAILSGMLWSEREDMLNIFTGGGWRVTDEDHEDAWWTAALARA